MECFVSNSEFMHNTADSGAVMSMASGGMVHHVCTMINSIFSNNSAAYGGIVYTVYAKRNAHLILIFFVASLGEGGQKCTWSIM